MNKKAIVTTFLTDIYSFLVFAIIVILFVVVFKPTSTPVEYMLVGSQISSTTELWVGNYFRMPVEVDINNDNVKENLTNAELISWYVNTHEPIVLTPEERLEKSLQSKAGPTPEPEQNYFVPPCDYGAITVYKPDSETEHTSMESYNLAYKRVMESTHAMDTFKRTLNYEFYIPSEANGKLSKIKVLVTCYE